MQLNNYNKTPLEWPCWVLIPIVFGYLTMTRSFAYLGVAPIYIGEAALGLLLFFRPEIILGTWVRAQLQPRMWANLAILSAIFVGYGLLQCLRGLEISNYPKTALQNFAFNFYIAFMFAGMWLSERHPDLLRRVIWYLAWINGIYGTLFLLILGPVVTDGGLDTDVIPLFGWPAGSAIVLLGLFAYETNFRRIIIPLLLNGFVMLGMQVRAEWLAFVLAFALLSVLQGRVYRLIQATVLLGGILLIGVIVDFKVPGPARHRGEISARDLVGRAVAAVDEGAAAEISENASAYSGTVSWRTEWWSILIDLTHRNPLTTLFGLGYGFPIWEHHPTGEGVTPTPHNVFMYALTYTGWVGVFIFYSLQLYLAWMFWTIYRTSGQAFGLCHWVLSFVWAHFDNRFETPYGAIPFYVLVGMALTSGSMTTSAPKEELTSSRMIGSPR